MLYINYLITSLIGVVAKYSDEYVCLSACVRGYLRNHTCDLYQSFGHAAYVRGFVLIRHVDDRLHLLISTKGWRECTA